MRKNIVLTIDIILLIFSILLVIFSCIQKYTFVSYISVLNVLIISYFIKMNLQ